MSVSQAARSAPPAERPAPVAAPPVSVLHCLWDGRIGGAERAIYQLVREQLRDPGLAPAVLFADGSGPYFELIARLGCSVVALELPHGHALRALPGTARAMRAFDVHHFHVAEPLLMLASRHAKGACRVYTHRGGITEYPLKKRVHYALVGRLLRSSFHGLSGNTAHAARCAGELFGLDATSFHVTYNGLEFELLDRSRTGRDARAELGLAAGDFVVGTTANLRRWKRIDRLLGAAARLRDPRVRVLVVGDGPDRARLETLAAELGIADRVAFTGAREQVADLLAAMDAFCLPSTGLESFGNAAVEAMGLGVPTIVFADGGGLVEHVESGATGFVVRDDEELVERLRALLADPGLRSAIGERGREAVRRRYTPAAAAAAYRDLYEAALGARDAGAVLGSGGRR